MKILDNLIERAQRSKDGVAKINGRQREYYGFGSEWIGDLEERYKVVIDGDTIELHHWGTCTLVLNLKDNKIDYYYGESSSDRDSMNYMLYYFLGGTRGRFIFRPSTVGDTVRLMHPDGVIDGVEV